VKPDNKLGPRPTPLETDTFNDKQSQTAERKTGDGRGPGDPREINTFINN